MTNNNQSRTDSFRLFQPELQDMEAWTRDTQPSSDKELRVRSPSGSGPVISFKSSQFTCIVCSNEDTVTVPVTHSNCTCGSILCVDHLHFILTDKPTRTSIASGHFHKITDSFHCMFHISIYSYTCMCITTVVIVRVNIHACNTYRLHDHAGKKNTSPSHIHFFFTPKHIKTPCFLHTHTHTHTHTHQRECTYRSHISLLAICLKKRCSRQIRTHTYASVVKYYERTTTHLKFLPQDTH
jgi:hypothetical protein